MVDFFSQMTQNFFSLYVAILKWSIESERLLVVFLTLSHLNFMLGMHQPILLNFITLSLERIASLSNMMIQNQIKIVSTWKTYFTAKLNSSCLQRRTIDRLIEIDKNSWLHEPKLTFRTRYIPYL